MKLFKKTRLPPTLIAIIGEEWNGEYTFYVITAKEYRSFVEELIQKARMENPDWNGEIAITELQAYIMHKTVKLNGKELPMDMPAKLYDLLYNVAVPLNMSTPAEARSLFLESSLTSPTESLQPSV